MKNDRNAVLKRVLDFSTTLVYYLFKGNRMRLRFALRIML